MATGKVIGRVEVSIGNVRIVDVDGNLRDTGYEGLMYEGEQIYSDDVNALFQIKYLALPEATVYDGIFRVLADGSVISGLEGNENFFGDDIDFMETAAGDAGPEGSSAFLEEVPVDESSLLGFSRGADDTGYGEGIVNFGEISETDGTPPVITSDNEVVFDENNPDAVMTVTALDTSALTFSISGPDSALFNIDPVTGVLRFNDVPDYENPLDTGGDNEYNLLVTVTDAIGNFTTQLVSVNVNNLNDNIPTAQDASASATEDVYDDVEGQLIGEDADGNIIRYELVDGLAEGEGTLTFNEDGSYIYNVGTDFQDLAEGETREVSFTYKTVEVGPPLSEPSDSGPFESEVATVTILITGTNDAPEATLESITKIADHVTTTDIPSYDDGDVTAVAYLSTWFGPIVTHFAEAVELDNGRYAVDDHSFNWFTWSYDGDKENFVDSKGSWNEGIIFGFESEVTQTTISLRNVDMNDRILVRTYDDNGAEVSSRYITSEAGPTTINISEESGFKTVAIFALDSVHGVTDFTVQSVIGTTEMDTVLPFVIDDSMLLANDTDAEGDAIHVELVDGKLLDAGGAEIGTVTLTEDGDIQVTPDADIDFDTSVSAYANFAYVVVDEHGAASEATTATIDVAVGTVVGSQIGYVPDGPQEFIIGTDSDALDALSDNVLTVSDTLDLSHISDINTIELGEDATVTGSADLGHITVADVMDATDLDNTLVIQSSDGNAHDQVNVHESFGDPNTVFSDGQWYAEYSAEGATLLVEIDPPIDAN
ncbi:Ig-like domain-containing protein [Sulfurimonas sp.]|uniref:Ig-like domain-containing protein n=1 Tax=Sulfurimonas sp. TaxID=2022749 RepID=UPI003567E6C4